MNLIEYIWKSTFQFVVWEQEQAEGDFPKYFGHGFIIKVDGNNYFVTADHVIHPADYEEGCRTNHEYRYAIPLFLNGEQEPRTAHLPLGGFVSAENYDLHDFFRGRESLETTCIPELEDIAFCAISEPLPAQPCTCALFDADGTVFVPQGEAKNCLSMEALDVPSKEGSYLVAGCIHNKLKGIQWMYSPRFYDGLSYLEAKDCLYQFRSSFPISIEDWAGLSGSPVFSSEGKLVGMLIRAVPEKDTLWAMPIQRIITFIRKLHNL